ncbi:hypothetical protein D3C72_909630 [compost metagenome]
MYKYSTILLSILSTLCIGPVWAQHNVDANAIIPTDTRISGWATGCTVQRGWMDIADHSQGVVTFGVEANATGAPGASTQVISLGDSGVAVLTFSNPIQNLDGPDFAVFENGFLDPENPQNAFLEFAFVEVSSDGQNYFRFPAQYTGADTPQCENSTYVDGTKYHNLAGRYINGYGTPFDLEELKNTAGLNVNSITHVRLIDVVGSIDPLYGSADKDGKLVNDPYPSAFASGGFDLSAVAVLNRISNGIKDLNGAPLSYIIPNPATDNVRIEGFADKNFYYRIVNVLGQEMLSGNITGGQNIDVSRLTAGNYYIWLSGNNARGTLKFVKH